MSSKVVVLVLVISALACIVGARVLLNNEGNKTSVLPQSEEGDAEDNGDGFDGSGTIGSGLRRPPPMGGISGSTGAGSELFGGGVDLGAGGGGGPLGGIGGRIGVGGGGGGGSGSGLGLGLDLEVAFTWGRTWRGFWR
nr:glycine-rich cell wall structural protein 1-like [Coffea arabica]